MRRTFSFGSGCIATVFAVVMLVQPGQAAEQSVPVRNREGAQRGFLVMRSQTGAVLASGEITQTPRGENIQLRVVFHFRDGSLSEETTLYSQKSTFHLISDRVVQKGPSFPNPVEMMIDAAAQQVSMKTLAKGSEGEKTEQMDLPQNISNGLLFNLIQDLPNNGPGAKVTYLSSESKPRLVTLAIAMEGEQRFRIAGRPLKAAKWGVKTELGGLTGIVAPLIGKQPPDMHVWVAEGEVPAIVRVEASFYPGGPMWTIQLASPTWR